MENLFHSFETLYSSAYACTSRSLFFVNKHQSECTRDAGVRVEREKEIQFPTSTLPYSLSRPLAYLLPIFWPAAQSSSAMHARVYREESCLKGREKWRGKKPGRTAEFPSSRFIIRPTRVFHLPSPLSPFLLLLFLSFSLFLSSPCSLVISCLTFFYVYSTGCRSEGFSCSKTLINEPSTRSFPSFLSSPRSHPSVTTVKAEDLSLSLFGARPPTRL